MKKKIIFFDIDGTIYSYKTGIPQDTAEAFSLLKQAGHIPVICTGRTKAMIFEEMFRLNTNALIAGAGTYVEADGTVIYQYEMDSEEAEEIIACMNECHIMPIAEGIHHLYYPLSDMNAEYQKVFRIYQEKIPDKIQDIQRCERIVVSKISGRLSEDSRLDRLKEKYQDRFNFVIHGGVLAEMIPKGYSKAVGIRKLIEYFNERNGDIISLDDTYAYGDSMNDFEMLNYVRYGVAMGNSDFDFKHNIKYVTEDFDQGGIRLSLKRFGLI